eukprot:364320-Chlamydomonas_euryale.AAC.1
MRGSALLGHAGQCAPRPWGTVRSQAMGGSALLGHAGQCAPRPCGAVRSQAMGVMWESVPTPRPPSTPSSALSTYPETPIRTLNL